jgi:hypothetical protein
MAAPCGCGSVTRFQAEPRPQEAVGDMVTNSLVDIRHKRRDTDVGCLPEMTAKNEQISSKEP